MRVPVVVALVTTGLLAAVSAEPREQFVFRLLSVYAAGPDQSNAADRDKNDQISDTEFLQSLFFFTDEKRDRRVTQAEFVDGYRRQFGLPSELLVIMFDLLDDFNDDGDTRQGSDFRDNHHNKFFGMFWKQSEGRGMFGKNHQNRGDGILTPADVTVRKFVGDNKKATKDDYKKSLMKWVAAAADRLYTINYQPHIPGNPWDMEFDYERWFSNVDFNNDSLVSFQELSDEFRRYKPDGRVRRNRWVDRNLKLYGDREWLANVVFDYWDKNKDMRLDDLDVGLILKEADRNRDMRVTTIEFHRFMEKYNKRARRRLATPIRPVMYDCPSPWWQSFGCRPRVDATRAAMDMDDNFDGWITQGELRKRVSYYDRNGDGWASRMEVMMLESMRYGVQGPVANIMFDVYDRNGDGRYDVNDVQDMLADGRVLCFCDARRAVLNLVKLAEKFRDSPQAKGPAGSLRNAMRWHLTRDWRWQQQAERLWHKIWGEGDKQGGTCREGDCTGKDWRGGAWYSPFDWRQKNRVPENFLQWSYLRDIPRTIAYPRSFFPWHDQRSPGGGQAWWNPKWPKGDNWNERGGQGPGGVGGDGRRGGGMNFPRRGPGGGGMPGQLPGATDRYMPMPKNFMPNPARNPARPGGFPRSSSNIPSTPPSLPSSFAEDNSAEELWTRLLAGLDNETASSWDPTWLKENAKFWQDVFNKGGSVPWLTQGSNGLDGSSGNQREDAAWRDRPGLFGDALSSKDHQPNLQIAVGKKHRQGTGTLDSGVRAAASGRGSMTDRRGRPRPTSGNFRFKRSATDSGDSSTPAPLPPSPTTQTGASGNTGSDPSLHSDDSPTLASSGTKSSVLDTDDNETQSGEQGNEEKNEDDGKSSGGAEKPVSRSLGWSPFIIGSWWDYAKDTSRCDDDSWVQQTGNDMSNMGVGDWDQQQRWVPYDDGMSGADIAPTVYPPMPYEGRFYEPNFPWWMRGFPNQRLGTNRFSPPLTRDNVLGGRRYFPFSRSWVPRYGPHRLIKRSPDETTNARNDKTAKWVDRRNNMGPFPNQWNNFGGFDRFNGHNGGNNMFTNGFGMRPQWWGMWNNGNPWAGGTGWNQNPVWRRQDMQTSSFPTNMYPSISTQDLQNPLNNQHFLHKRSSDVETAKQSQYNDEQFAQPPNSPFSYPQFSGPHKHVILKRSMDYPDSYEQYLSTLMNGRNSYQPQLWNRWNMLRPWYGNWNRNWMWKSNDWNGHNFAEDKPQSENSEAKVHIITKRDSPSLSTEENHSSVDGEHSVAEQDNDRFSRMMGGYGGYWPQRWNMWNNYRDWPSYWNNWMWNNNRGYYPFFYSNGGNTMGSNVRTKRNSDGNSENSDKVSRMMGGYGGYWPQWWNSWNGYWPGYWLNCKWRWNDFYPFGFAAKTTPENGEMEDNVEKEQVVKRSTREQNKDDISRMMGGYGGHWPQWWYMWNRYWPGYWMNWQWRWNGFHPFGFATNAKTPKNEEAQDVHGEHTVVRRSTRKQDKDEISRMMGGYGGYWPQWWNMWNNYRYWPSYWNNNWMGNSYMGYYPFYHSQDPTPMHSMIRTKRNVNDHTESADEVSRMMGGYGGHWPQWWYMWNRYWPGYWMNWQRMWNGFGFATKGKTPQNEPTQNVHRDHAVVRRSTSEQDKDEISRMMGGYGGYWPQWWNMWSSYRYWPGYWNGGMWNNYRGYYPFHFSRDSSPMGSNMRTKRSVDENSGEVSRMMRGYGGYWPQWWYMWNRYWPGYWMNWRWMWNGFHPFGFANNEGTTENKEAQDVHDEHTVVRRSTHEQDKDDISRMMGGYGGYWPQWWNMWSSYRSWPGYWNGGMWNNYRGYNPFYFSKDSVPMGSKIRAKRNADGSAENSDAVSRMMGGYGGYWPQWWNMWNRYWPGYWMNWRWMGNGFHPYGFTAKGKGNNKEEAEEMETDHTVTKRNTFEQQKKVSRMMGGPGSYWPQWRNMWSSYGYWPSYWNNWSSGWMGNHRGYYPFYFSEENQPTDSLFRTKRNAVDSKENPDKVSRMMGGYGGYWPQWGYMWNRYWPDYWMNWQGMWNGFYPFGFATEGKNLPESEVTQTDMEKEHTVLKRSTQGQDENEISKMMGGPDSYWPQQGNMWNNNRYWPSNWNNNWMWNSYRGYYPFQFSKTAVPMASTIRRRRNADDKTESAEEVSRMMGGYGGYWPQWWNMWNNYRYWPSYGNNNRMWNNNMGYYPFYYSQDATPMHSMIRTKRNVDDNTDSMDEVSRMMGGYGGHWPQWWNMWNNYRYWPSYGNNNRMWNNNMGYYPFYYSQDATPMHSMIRTKRNVNDNTDSVDEVSRMMGGYGGHWPQWWNMWNNYRYWPSYGNNNRMWNNNMGYYPFHYSKDATPMHSMIRTKRNVDDNTDSVDEVSRMMGGYGGYMWNRYWPGYWMNWRWMRNQFYPFGFASNAKTTQNEEENDVHKEQIVVRRSTRDQDKDEISRMMGGYGGYWPQWWNMWSSYRYWPGYWNGGMWNNYQGYYPFYFSSDSSPMGSNMRAKRNADASEEKSDEVSRMMGGYGGYWPQWWYMWNRYWPGYGMNWQWMWNGFYPFGFATKADTTKNEEAVGVSKEDTVVKRSTRKLRNGEISRMMGGYGGYWPQWWNMWGSYRSWPGYWNGGMWNNYRGYNPFYFSKDSVPMGSKIRAKRSADDSAENSDAVSRMMGGYGGYWPQWWNMWNRYWPGYWMNWRWMGNGFHPYGFTAKGKGNNKEEAEEMETDHTVTKRNTFEQQKKVSRMMGGPGSYWPQWRNMWSSYGYWPSYWNNWSSGWMGNHRGYYPFYFSEENQPTDSLFRTKRNAVDSKENPDKVSRMMGGYGGYWPQWGYMWNRYWPDYWMNWQGMWNGFYPFGFATEGKNLPESEVTQKDMEKEHTVLKRSTQGQDENEISKMMGGPDSYWPQQGNMWNNNRYWPRNWNNNWMWNSYRGYYPFQFSKTAVPMASTIRRRRNADDKTESAEEVSRMMGGYGGYWPQWWNMWNNYRYWPSYGNNNRMWNNNMGYYPFYYSQDATPMHSMIRTKRNVDDNTDSMDEVSRMMGGYGGHWPQWWNMWNNYRYWPSYGNNNRMWNNNMGYYPFYYSQDATPMHSMIRTKRDVNDNTDSVDEVSRMMGGYGGNWPRWWNMWNRYWPGYWMNWQWMWKGFYPFGFASNAKKTHNEEAQDVHEEHTVVRRSTHEQDKDEISRMMGGYGGYWPQWWNMWNNYRYWPSYWNGGMWNNQWGHYPFYFSKTGSQMGSNIRAKRDAEGSEENSDEVSRMMGGYGGYWPQWWYMWNRYWPGYWMNWRWMWNGFYPFGFTKTSNKQEADDVHKLHSNREQARMRRNTRKLKNDQISRMMGGYGSYWPQWWNMWNNYRYWPSNWNNWMWNNYRGYYPFYFSKDNIPMGSNLRTKRNTNDNAEEAKEVSRMMGGYGGYWPQWGYMWNRYWPGYRMDWQWMWNGFQPFGFATDAKTSEKQEADEVHKVRNEREQARMKRSTSKQDKDEISRMMGGYGSYWPQWWNMWNSYRHWPSYWNGGMWNNQWGYYPFHFAKDGNQMGSNMRAKRDADDSEENSDEVSRMMGGYGGYWPQWWYMWNRYWPGYWMNWRWMWNGFYPFGFANNAQMPKDKEAQDAHKEQIVVKRSTHEQDKDEISRMMGGYGGYWPQWWNMWNNYRYWPGYWNNGMWNNYRGYYPSHFSKGSIPLGPNIRTKRNANDDTDRADEVSRMMGGYGGYWPQWGYMWNRYWPGYGMNRQWMTWNAPSSFAYATEGQDTPTNEETYEHVEKEHTLQKRSIPDQGRDLSSMMGGPGSYWPQWWSMWNSYRYWPSYWNNMMWNGNRGYYPFYFSTERNPVRSNVRTKRSAGGDTENVDRNKDDISKMMGGYDGFWPQQWNMRNQYPANGWNNWYGNNNYQWMWDRSGRYVPPRSYYFTKGLESRNKQHEISRRSTSTKEARSQESTEKVAHMMGLYMNPSAHPWNTMNMGGPWPGADRGRMNWPGWRNNDQWMSNSPAYIPYNWLGYPQGAGRGFPSDREQPQMWNYNNNMDVFRTFYPSAFSQNRESQVKSETTDQESKTHLEKRSAEATPSEQKTTDNTEDTNSTKSKSKPSVSRQMSPYERYPGNMFQQYWLKLYKSYLNSRPRYWSNGPGFSAYDNLYDGVIGVLYGSRYGRCYYVRFIIPWAGYLQMLNNRVLRGDYPMWSLYSSHQSPTPFEEFMAPVAEPDLPIGQQKDSEATENEKAEEEVAATENEERRKRSTAYLNPDSQFSPGRFDDYNFYNGWPNGWRDPMYNYNFWPRFGAAMPRPGRGNWNSWVRPEYSQPFTFSEKQNTDNKKVAQQQGFDSSAGQHDKEISKHKTKRSAQQHGTEDQQSADEKLSRWFSVPSQGFGQPMWQQQDSWMYQTFQDSRWNRGQDSTFRNSQLDLNRNKLNQYFLPNVGINPWSGNSPHGNDWGSLGTRSPFDFSQDIKDTDERAAEENAQLAGNTRRKRSSDASSPSQDDKKKTEEEIKQFKVSRAGRGFPPISPRAWNTYGSRLFDDRQWMRYNWPGFDSNQQRPWWSSWNFWNQYQNTPDWNQYQYVNQNPSMDPALYGPGLNWRGGNEMYNSDQWKDFVYSQQKPNRYENKFVDESIFDPLSSYYFSQTGASGKNNAEKKLKEGKAGSAKSNSKMKENNGDQPRTKRSAISLTNVLSKRQSLEPNRLMKRSAPKKIKRFSPDAIKRLERRFQKRSATSTQDSKKDKSETADAETAPVMAMRATAPARGSSSRDREWGPPRGSGFAPNPNPSSRQGSLDQAAEQNSISGQGPDTFGDYGGQDDWNWGQPGWDEKQKWSDEQKSGPQGSGSGMAASMTTSRNANSLEDGSGDSIVNGDPQNRLSNYNYIDFNNPNYWNQFYNPSSFNSTSGGPLANASHWNDWFSLWAYGPNFWDDMNDLDLWDAPWVSAGWLNGRGDDQWAGSMLLVPNTRYASMPEDDSWDSFSPDDCDDFGDWESLNLGSLNLGYRPWNNRDWWNPGYSFRSNDQGCRNCIRPNLISFLRPFQQPFRPGSLPSRPFVFRSMPGPMGSSATPWFALVPTYSGPWKHYGKTQWSSFPWWDWTPNSHWNPWRYRIQYHNDLGHKIQRTRRSASPTSNSRASQASADSKLAPTASTVTKTQSPTNFPSALSPPFNDLGLAGPQQFPPVGKLGPYGLPTLAGPHYHPQWGASSTNGWSNLPWWDKNNWHVADAGHRFGGGSGSRRTGGGGRNVFRPYPGRRRFPAGPGVGGRWGDWRSGGSLLPGWARLGRPASSPWRGRPFLPPMAGGFHGRPLRREGGAGAGDTQVARARRAHEQSR